MDLFISWSGERSRCIAEALRNWIPMIMNAVQPWLSCADIEKGARWSTDVATKLETSKVGIICLTPGNVHSDWILFEAGALSKTLQNTFVCPLLEGLEPADIKGPLAQFQATRATKDEIKKLLITINSALGDNALADGHLGEAFEVWWPKLKEKLQTLPPEQGSTSPQRQERDILEEILGLVRMEARTQQRQIPPQPILTSRAGGWADERWADTMLEAAREVDPSVNHCIVEHLGTRIEVNLKRNDGLATKINFLPTEMTYEARKRVIQMLSGASGDLWCNPQ
ncbi:MAG: TIR domain-containing protein [Acidobacteriota bacterium]